MEILATARTSGSKGRKKIEISKEYGVCQLKCWLFNIIWSLNECLKTGLQYIFLESFEKLTLLSIAKSLFYLI